MEQELEKLKQLNISKNSILKDVMAPGTPKSILLSASIKREGDSPTSPHSSDDIHHSDRYQTFLRVRANRQTRLNARIGKMKRRKQDEGQREGSCMMEDDSVDIENENGNRFEEYEWCGQKRIRATTLLEGGFRECSALTRFWRWGQLLRGQAEQSCVHSAGGLLCSQGK
uniref:E3 ubiquitin-protein ligase RNF220 middle domain-containing protein n=1 Tax=Anolis carolinensis TaxID=28377 RepID=A0A803SPR1_ANOCA